MPSRPRRILLCVLCGVLFAPIAGAHVLRRAETPSLPGEPLSPLLVQTLRLDPASVRTLGIYSSRDGGDVDVVYGRRVGGAECLVAVGHGGTGAGCGGLFARGPVAILEGSSGGPKLERRSNLEVVGWARPNVARVAIVDTSGRTREAPLNENNAFVLEFGAAELQAGVGPAELVADDKTGAELMRLDLSEPGS